MDPALEQLLERAERSFAGRPQVRDAFAQVRAIIGPASFPNGETLAQQAMDALRRGEVPSPSQRAALETVIKALRPSILSRRGELNSLPDYGKYSATDLEGWEKFRQAVKPYIYAVGRIDRVNRPSDDALATGFLVAPGLLVTNRHVLAALSAGAMTLEPGQAVVRFGQEYDTAPDAHPPAAIRGVVAVHPSLDIALLEVTPPGIEPLRLHPAPLPRGRKVAVVGYPQADPRNPVFMDVVFGNKYKVKRAAPGEVVGQGPDAVYHDCSTLGGNSGSPLLCMETAAVAGLHRDGPLFLYRNEAVDGASLEAFLRPHLGGD